MRNDNRRLNQTTVEPTAPAAEGWCSPEFADGCLLEDDQQAAE